MRNPRRLPITMAAARAAKPEFMCTTVPPAKSSAPRSRSQPPGAHTQWARGAYTRNSHRVVNRAKAENFIRSAKAPVIRAGVMAAKKSWKTA